MKGVFILVYSCNKCGGNVRLLFKNDHIVVKCLNPNCGITYDSKIENDKYNKRIGKGERISKNVIKYNINKIKNSEDIPIVISNIKKLDYL